jgi:hypothetical protein
MAPLDHVLIAVARFFRFTTEARWKQAAGKIARPTKPLAVAFSEP